MGIGYQGAAIGFVLSDLADDPDPYSLIPDHSFLLYCWLHTETRHPR
jgi:hypothetical protein